MKKILALLLCLVCVFSVSAKSKKRESVKIVQTKSKYSVQVVMPELENISGNEKNWLGGQIRDKFKSNLQEFLGMETFVDSKSEAALIKIQKESESSTHDEKTAIELGKISTAKYALFSTIRKTNSGFIITVDFTDLKTGKIEASATSKEYSSVEYLYGTTGAVDEITLNLSTKLNISISSVNKNVLTSGSAGLSIDEQIALAKENEENYKRISSQYDAEIRTLKASSDILATEDIKRIEAEKELLSEKQQTEKKRQQELLAQKKQAEADAKLEAERSIALKTQRDKMAQEALLKAEEARKLKVATAGILGKINIIEAKKKALVEIRNSVESRQQELFAQLEKDRVAEEQRIRAKSYSTVELDNGKPTEAAKERREKQVIKSYEDLTNKFFTDAEAVKQSTMSQQNALLSEINADVNALKDVCTVSSMGDELKVSFGTYSGSKNGWNAYLSLYSDGVLLFTDSFIVGYEAVSGKKAPNMETELDDAVIEEYANNVDMYNSLFTRGSPILTFEIDSTTSADDFKNSSSYKILFKTLRVKNTVSGKIVQTTTLNKDKTLNLSSSWNLQEKAGIVAKEKEKFAKLEIYIAKGLNLGDAKNAETKFKNSFNSEMIKIPNQYYAMQRTEVTQAQYKFIMGENPSEFKGDNLPAESLSWEDAIYFCNKLSDFFGYEPVYKVNGTTDVTKWGYTPHRKKSFSGTITQDISKNGFRLATSAEWEFSAKGGEYYIYAGWDEPDKAGWYKDNSEGVTHPIAKKLPNAYGLYDMFGNVWEWTVGTPYDVKTNKFIDYKFEIKIYSDVSNIFCGGSFDMYKLDFLPTYRGNWENNVGFRVVRTIK